MTRTLPASDSIRYFIRGEQVDRNAAIRRWYSSKTYSMASARTRDYIFLNAEEGIDDGGVTNHLAEAGITITLE